MVDKFTNWCCEQHDIVCNQKYGNNLPYSYHLESVARLANKFFKNSMNFSMEQAVMVAYGHDLIEDARVTFNDVHIFLSGIGTGVTPLKSVSAARVARCIYNCTESTGRNREERHDEAYLERLLSDGLSVFVKLCDITANVLYGLANSSRMPKKYKVEVIDLFSKIREKYDSFNYIMDYIDNLLRYE